MNPVSPPILAKSLSALHAHGIKHGFFTRQNGVSKSFYPSLNAEQSLNDKSEYITQNRILIANYFGAEVQNLVTVNQIHSCEVVVVHQAFIDKPPEVDSLVTTMPGLAIGILTADCGPVLFADPQAGVIAAAHAGWRGSLKGIIEKQLLLWKSKEPKDNQ